MRDYVQIKNISSGWAEPSDWIDINTVADNEILLLVTEGTGIGFTVKVGTGTGTFIIDWGDGNVQGPLTGNGTTVYQHQHATGGTPCSLGYNTWKVRIYFASGDITGWKVARHSYVQNVQQCPILSANIGAMYLSTYSSLFYDAGALMTFPLLKKCKIKSFGTSTSTGFLFYNCNALASVTLPTTWGSITNTTYMFRKCYALASVTLPTSWGSITNTSYMFEYCYAVTSLNLGTSWGSVTNTSYMFQYCYAITSVTLPTTWGSVTTIIRMFFNCNALTTVTMPDSWGSITNASNLFVNCLSLVSINCGSSWGGVTTVSNMFFNCYALTSVTLPASWGSVTDVSYMFYCCYSLKTINNLQWLGNQTAQSDFTDFLYTAEFLQQAISIGSLLSRVGIVGASGKLLLCSTIRLTNAGSTFTGSSPQVNISYTSLGAAALNLLFGDLPTLVGKTINITGCPGAASCTRSIATAKGWTVTG